MAKVLLFPFYFFLKTLEFSGEIFAYLLNSLFTFSDWIMSHYE